MLVASIDPLAGRDGKAGLPVGALDLRGSGGGGGGAERFEATEPVDWLLSDRSRLGLFGLGGAGFRLSLIHI